ncbi:hypothetical protein Q4489_10045 [Thalassotalea sp. 1_MG-2023]|uniref:hypothetical protein n=1 Tax=Thalassotalea sp. 1_MG-2023 TaxID=3062680 RepID=UPI0026E4661C|nr:hypothetical protein [Thalassotalea sp. 1_MG-2023]MDO6427356.1 hypothetical protein [Thalassotalea sp. 1_MG-2023]
MALFSWFNAKNQSLLPQTQPFTQRHPKNIKHTNNWPTTHIPINKKTDINKILPLREANAPR